MGVSPQKDSGRESPEIGDMSMSPLKDRTPTKLQRWAQGCESSEGQNTHEFPEKDDIGTTPQKDKMPAKVQR